MEILEVDGEEWSEVRRHHEQWHANRALGAAKCGLGSPFFSGTITEGQSTLYILGFNAGEPKDPSTDGPNTISAKKWLDQCERMRRSAGTEGFISAERCYWGSPSVGELIQRLGDRVSFRDMLRIHASANRALFRQYTPLIVWVPGVSTYLKEAIEDYGLRQCEPPAVTEKKGRQHTIWRLYRDATNVPFLFSKHPASRPSRPEWVSIRNKVSELAATSFESTQKTDRTENQSG
jgi:hypothetical protein